ncbi:HIT domain-containing protein [Candidatus Woesearchaeota archaeon]|nr:HIT domain-containing protein [Candidatus Woesearchaeota archaeon]
MPSLSPEQQALQEKIKNMSPEELREFQKQQCIFCQIITGKIPSKKIYDDANSLAILDINPAARGHILLLPKEHYGILPQMPDDLLGALFSTAKRLSQVVLKVLKVSGTTIFVANGLAAGQKAPHVMLHIIPRKEGDGLFALQPRLVDAGVLSQVTAAVGQKFNEVMGIKKEALNAGVKSSVGEPVKEKLISSSAGLVDTDAPLPAQESVEKNLTTPKKKRRQISRKKTSSTESAADEDADNGASSKRTTSSPTQEISLDDIAKLFK